MNGPGCCKNKDSHKSEKKYVLWAFIGGILCLFAQNTGWHIQRDIHRSIWIRFWTKYPSVSSFRVNSRAEVEFLHALSILFFLCLLWCPLLAACHSWKNLRHRYVFPVSFPVLLQRGPDIYPLQTLPGLQTENLRCYYISVGSNSNLLFLFSQLCVYFMAVS